MHSGTVTGLGQKEDKILWLTSSIMYNTEPQQPWVLISNTCTLPLTRAPASAHLPQPGALMLMEAFHSFSANCKGNHRLLPFQLCELTTLAPFRLSWSVALQSLQDTSWETNLYWQLLFPAHLFCSASIFTKQLYRQL